MAESVVIINPGYTLRRLGMEPETEICLNCKHFHQHYSKSYSVMLALDCGHCSFPRMKFRRVSDICKNFENRNQALNKEGGGHEPKNENRQA